MKLLRFGSKGNESPGLLDDDGVIRDLSAHVGDIDGAALDPRVLDSLRALDTATLPAIDASTRLGPPVAEVGKVIAVGLNYRDHAEEAGHPIPAEPILFMKATSSISGPNDDVIIPRNSIKTDYEVELGIVIGRQARYVEEVAALDYVAGYCVVNDVSERAFQSEGTGQWTKGKSADTFCPFGPWLVTTDEVPDPQSLRVWLDLDGEHRQDGSTSTMIFGVAHLVAYISQFMTLHPGDLIPTGTPPGVGLGMKPPAYLRPGNQVNLGIDGLGAMTHQFVACAD